MLEEKVEKQDLLSRICRIGDQIQFPFLISDPSLSKEPIVYVNKLFTKLISNEEAIGQSKPDIIKESFNFIIKNNELQEHQKVTLDNTTIVSLKKASSIFYEYSEQKLFDNNGNHIFTLLVLVNITKFKNEIYNVTFFDPISHLPNYQYFTEHFDNSVNVNSNGFILLIQPGEYANIVDAFGKNYLGFLLKELNKRFIAILEELPIIISRATEGSLIISANCKDSETEEYVQKLLEAVHDPFVIDDIELFISLKIGVVSFKYFKGNIDELVRYSDIALSNSKLQAGNAIVYYEEYFSKDLKEKILIQNELVHAIRNNDIRVHLQPKVNILDGKIVSFEALARWFSSKYGQVPPVMFIEAAETIGKIEELDFIIIEQVLHWLSNRKQQNLALYQVSVNISPTHFYTPFFTEKLLTIVNRFRIDPIYIKIELTENIGLVDLARAKQIIHDLKQLGFECSVDDFGIGFSSLSYLHQLPVNELKIDRSFINNLHDHGGSEIVKTIIQLARSMNLTAVAEGIESEHQLEVIRSMSCQVAQGYYFYKPMSLQEIDHILTN